MKKEIRVKLGALVSQAVEDGLVYGIGRVNKYRENDSKIELRDAESEMITSAIMSEIDEIIDFDPEMNGDR